MEDIIIPLIILSFAVLIGSVLGFGDSLVFISITSLFLEIRAVVVLMGFWTLALSVLNAIKYRQLIDTRFLKKFLLPGILGVILGSYLMVIVASRWIEFSLGGFILIYVSSKIIEMRNVRKDIKAGVFNPKLRNIDSVPGFIFYSGAFSYGFIGGLIGASGPINVVLLERCGYEKERFIANFSITSVILNSFRLNIYVLNSLFPVDYLLLFLLGFIVVFVVTRIGHWITPRIPKTQFQILVLILLTLVGFRLILTSLFIA